MKYILTFLLLLPGLLLAQNKNFSISGTVRDAKTGEELIGANIKVKETGSGAITNTYGFYSISLPAGTYNLSISYLGYDNQTKIVKLAANTTLNIELSESIKDLSETVITGKRADDNVSENKMSVVSIDVKTVKKIPLLAGEADLIKALQLLPGVQAAGDGSTQSIVRGGNFDHNLVLLDEAVVYNPSHAVGFFSVFNGDAIKDFELYKGGIPSRYGGRLASVLDVRMRDGNSKNYNVSGGIGILSSRLTIEGPIQKEKSNFLLSARRSYFDVFFPLAEQTRDATLYFGDLNAKMSFKLSEKDRLYVSAYTGADRLGFGGLFGFGWGNTTFTTRWNHLFNPKWFVNTSLIYSRYNYRVDFNISPNLNSIRRNFIDDYTIKSDFTNYYSNKSTFKMGFWGTYHNFSPGRLEPITSESIISAATLPNKKTISTNFYGSHEYKHSARLTIEYGLRISTFSNVGGREFVYANGQKNFFRDGSIRPGAIVDTTFYQDGEIYNTHINPEPRFNATYKINSVSSIKGSYNRMVQYLHLIQNVTASTGQEFWTPTTPSIKPQVADQVAIGYFRNFFDNTWEGSVEVYYKNMMNTVEIIDNANLNFNEAIESQLVAGQGRAYGAEFYLKKNVGATTGWISYTLSKSERRADNINRGEWYNFRFDRRHYLTVIVSHDFNKRFNVSGNFVFATGDAFTGPVGQYVVNGRNIALYSDRNALRIPAYHRMDLSATLITKKKEGKYRPQEASWVFSIYNVYARKNFFSLEFRPDENTGANAAFKSYLFTIVPAVTYNFKF